MNKERQKLIIDFDGTIVDIWDRYYYAFCYAANITALEKTDYIRLKKHYVKDDVLANTLGIVLPNDYYWKKRKSLEDWAYLKLDRLIISKNDLMALTEKYDCSIVSKRRNQQLFYRELEYLELDFLKNISTIIDPDLKISKRIYLGKPSNVIVVGDSDEEYEFALEKNIVFMVDSGLRNNKDYQGVDNCILIDNINYLCELDY